MSNDTLTTTKVSSFKKWYDANKEEFAKRRRERYHADETFRKNALERSASYRRGKRVEERGLPPGYSVTHSDACEKLGIEAPVLRAWARKNYYPEPFQANKRIYFTEGQITLLTHLVAFFQMQPPHRRLGPIALKKLDELTSYIHANWN
jgi:hypothetical protein